ncbi:MAG: hypothetical protein VKI42_08475 [Synechococcaceae cyanobacterium]|nr:hypothetical protein [Synechococcaceae cyanobacterium]
MTSLHHQFKENMIPDPPERPSGRKGFLPLLGVALTTVLCPGLAHALDQLDPGILSFEPSPISSTVPFEGTVGWDFFVHEARKISFLGVYDAAADGLAVATEVGLWSRDTGSLLASATVPAGTTGRLFGQFRYTEIPELTLQPGVQYALGALYIQPYSSDRYLGFTSTTVQASWIDQHASNFSFQCGAAPTLCSSNLVLPQQYGNFAADGFYGPNVAGILAPVPGVPAPLPILGLGAAFHWSRALRQRRNQLG